jgi:hypothetical protein
MLGVVYGVLSFRHALWMAGEQDPVVSMGRQY